MDCIFCKIIKKEIPGNILYETENVIVFEDIHPKAPTHLLVVPKSHVKEFIDRDKAVFNEMMELIDRIIKEKNLDKNGYKIELNGGGKQLVDHFHVHLLGGAVAEAMAPKGGVL
jgi:histidine triad (HIT) family protein